MPLRQFVWQHGGNGMHLMRCDDGTFDVANLSSIRFPYIVIFEDLRIITLNATGQCTVNLDVSDLDGNDIKIKNSNDCIFVEGKREFHDGKSWVQYQVCRRLPLPNGYQVKSVHSKHASYGRIDLTVKMEGIWEAVPDLSPATKTVLMCEGVVQDAGTRTGPLKVKLQKIQPKVVSFSRREQSERRLLGHVNTNLQQMYQTEDSEESDSDESVEQNEQLNYETVVYSRQMAEPVQSEESESEEEEPDVQLLTADRKILGQRKTLIFEAIACGPDRGPSASSYKRVVYSRHMAEPVQSEESESEEEEPDVEVLMTTGRKILGQRKTLIFKDIACGPDREPNRGSYRNIAYSRQMAEPFQAEEEQPDVELYTADRKILGQRKTLIYKEIACGPDREPSASSYRKVVYSRQMAEPVQYEESESEEEQPGVEWLTADRKILGQRKTLIYKEIACGPDREPTTSSYRKVIFSRQLAEPVQSEEEQPDEELLTAGRRYPSVDPKTVWAELTAISQNEVKINLDWELEKARSPINFKTVY